MARLRTRMSKIKEALRLKFDCHLANRSISACLNIGCSTISDVVTRFRGSQLAWPLPEDMAALNLAISELLQDLNERPFRRLPGCWKSQFEQLDKPALKALPPYPYEYVDIRRAKVGPDYHVLYGKHAYSVPHALVGSHIDIEAGARLVRLYHKGILVAQHPRAQQQGGFTTQTDHMPESHRQQRWSPDRFCHGVRVSAALTGQWWSGICITAPTLSRLTGPAWGCSISAGNMEKPGWKMPVNRHCYWNAPGGR
ncbi:hypothetical protein DFO52_11610 [Enterobacter sp. AG326]|nr:hypothetical protein DFO52_11610 [Enterobacter sp. AG326]